jgi:predicted nucleic acid-binding protein
VLSFINELEILSGAYFFPEEMSQISVFLKDQIIINYRPELKEIIVKLRAKKKLKLPDAIVAATALYYNLPLVSSDKSFKGVEGLDFIYYEPVIS